jgi:radial spoke head protein 9
LIEFNCVEGGADGEKADETVAGEEGDANASKVKQENLSDLSEEEEIKIPPKDLNELDRLAFVVFAIENDCSIAPIGAFKMTPLHQVRRNEAYTDSQSTVDI